MFITNSNRALTRFCEFIKPKTSHELSCCRFFAAQNKLDSKVNYDSSNDVSDVSEEHNFSPAQSNSKKSAKIVKLPFNDTSLSEKMLQMKSKKMRMKSNLIYFEGRRLLIDALCCGIVPLSVYFTKTKDIVDLDIPEKTKLLKIPYNELKIWSDMTTCPGILTICQRPSIIDEPKVHIPVSVICDNVRDPGNLGSVIRSSAGASIQNIFLTEGCVDPWDPKVIRGGMGTHFRIPIYDHITWDGIDAAINKNTLFLVSTNKKHDPEILKKKGIVPYYEVNYPDFDHITLVIGGETEGISERAVKFGKQFDYQEITIPLSNEVESLNCVSALSVILFEIKRQFETLK